MSLADDALGTLARSCSLSMGDDPASVDAHAVAQRMRAVVGRAHRLRGWVAAARALAERGPAPTADAASDLDIVRDARAVVFDAALERFAPLDAARRRALAWAVRAAPRDAGWELTYLDFSADASAPARVTASLAGAAAGRWLRAAAALGRFADVWPGGTYDAERDDEELAAQYALAVQEYRAALAELVAAEK